VKEQNGLDTTIIEGLIAEIGPESMARVLDAMAGDAERLLLGLQRALENADAKAFSLYAHSMKSNAQTVGANDLGAMMQELETLGCQGRLEGLSERAAQATAAYRELIGYIVTVPDTDSITDIDSGSDADRNKRRSSAG
jgi:HPt (histidine-containing phosphotransfer) domain-containing protein